MRPLGLARNDHSSWNTPWPYDVECGMLWSSTGIISLSCIWIYEIAKLIHILFPTRSNSIISIDRFFKTDVFHFINWRFDHIPHLAPLPPPRSSSFQPYFPFAVIRLHGMWLFLGSLVFTPQWNCCYNIKQSRCMAVLMWLQCPQQSWNKAPAEHLF